MEDYITQRTELTYTPGTQVGDVQCLAVPIVDDNVPEPLESFFVNIFSFSPLVRVFPGRETTRISIRDNDSKFSSFNACFLIIILLINYPVQQLLSILFHVC